MPITTSHRGKTPQKVIPNKYILKYKQPISTYL